MLGVLENGVLRRRFPLHARSRRWCGMCVGSIETRGRVGIGRMRVVGGGERVAAHRVVKVACRVLRGIWERRRTAEAIVGLRSGLGESRGVVLAVVRRRVVVVGCSWARIPASAAVGGRPRPRELPLGCCRSMRRHSLVRRTSPGSGSILASSGHALLGLRRRVSVQEGVAQGRSPHVAESGLERCKEARAIAIRSALVPCTPIPSSPTLLEALPHPPLLLFDFWARDRATHRRLELVLSRYMDRR